MTKTTEIEIERRFLTPLDSEAMQLVREGADYTIFIDQAYPPELTTPYGVGRVRCSSVDNGLRTYERTVKRPISGSIGVEEENTPIEALEASRLFGLAGERVLRKLRTVVTLEPGIVAMIDCYTHIRREPVELVTTEIEFDTALAAYAEEYTPPAWVGWEITGQPGWSNYELCLHGIPCKM